MKHLVTGGSGFLGNLIAKRLLARGEAVRVLDIWDDPARSPAIEFINCDIRNREGVARAMHGVDVVHHNVALVPLSKSGKKFWDVNVNGSRIAAEEAAKAGVRGFIHMSSSAIYGCPDRLPITDATPMRPVEIYGRGKLAGEQAVQAALEASSVRLVVIRPRTILGEGRLGIFQILFDWIRDGRSVYVIGSGNILFQFVHAHDLMDAYLLALDADKPGVYNVGAERFGTLREGLETLIRHAGTTSRVRSLPEKLTINTLRLGDLLGVSPLAPWHYLTYHKPLFFDVSKLLALGWKPKYSTDEMFRESYDWFCANHDKIDGKDAKSPHRGPVKEGILRLLKKLS